MFISANIIQPLIDAVDAILVFFHDNVGLSWGLSIIALTIVVRAALIPLTLKQFKSMQRLQQLQPQIKAIQAKYKDDKQRQNQEMMKFYQENKVNPLGSCLPLVFQLPVFLALFYMLRTDLKRDICGQYFPQFVETHPAQTHGKTITDFTCDQIHSGSAQFGFIPDLTGKATGAVLVVLIVLYVGSQIASTLLMSATADKNQRRLFLALPLFFVIFIISFPAGLIVYWITTNCWTIAQQYIVKRTAGPLKPAVAAGAAAAVPERGGGGSGGTGTGDRGDGESDDSGAGGGGILGRLLGGATPKAGATAEGDGNSKGAAKPKAPPPPPPRRKKKRSGRRR
ncbi:MAG TPA: YidC/Oxa1 family membrane protein insertase [Solirubrobacteraceae bacterium]|jgi:YidC/Oxa1 family membrane protein insertase|nr:YidC/Oxa1 family membrane protein insertase [Solirubrobacteraceae bacterium]